MADQGSDYNKLFDHEYDGIREYDNPMPGWWVWIFVGSIIFALPYVMWFHFGEGPSIHDQYEGELAAFAEQLLETYGDLQPDEATILSFMDDDVAMAGMSSLFKSKCARCHLADGGGNVGPNLTDDHYINITSLAGEKGIPWLLEVGSVPKGMPAWKDQLTTTQIVLLSSYVARLRGTNVPGGIAPKGNMIEPWPEFPSEEPASP